MVCRSTGRKRPVYATIPFDSVLEDAANIRDLVAEPSGSPTLRHPSPQLLEVEWPEMLNQSRTTELVDDQFADLFIVVEHPLTEFARVELLLFGFGKQVAQLADTDAAGHSDRLVTVELLKDKPIVFGLSLFATIAIDTNYLTVLTPIPVAEVVSLAVDLLEPLAVQVRRQGELGGLLWRVRFLVAGPLRCSRLTHGTASGFERQVLSGLYGLNHRSGHFY